MFQQRGHALALGEFDYTLNPVVCQRSKLNRRGRGGTLKEARDLKSIPYLPVLCASQRPLRFN
jgi:hypothetical protein